MDTSNVVPFIIIVLIALGFNNAAYIALTITDVRLKPAEDVMLEHISDIGIVFFVHESR